MKIFKLNLLLILINISLTANCQNLIVDSAVVKKQAEQMMISFIAKDYDSFIEFNSPKIIELMGGKENLKEILINSLKEMENEGFTIDSVSIGSIEKIVQAGDEIHVLLPQKLIIKTQKGKLISNSYLIAISTSGTKWYFVDAGKLTAKNRNLIFPNYNEELVIPAKQPPILVEQ